MGNSFRLVFLTSAFVLIAAVTGIASEPRLNQGVQGISIETLFPASVFDSSAPSFEELTGIEPGSRPLRPEEVLSALSRLAEISQNARLVEYARSHEDRPLVFFAISDSETIDELDEFKDLHAAYLDSPGAATSVDGVKAVAWMAYGIHGDELSSPDAAVALAYWLSLGRDDRAQALRDTLLILIDPSENPDGRGRYLAQTQSFAHRTANPDQDDLSHTNVWPWGRGNHYLFDMNRDWFMMTQPESARSRHIAEWLPELIVDCHEMGSNDTYLFTPPRHPFSPHFPPNARKWEEPFSEDQAKALDEHNYPHYTGEWNEEFFPGYGSSWAAYHGAIGFLYEMSRTSGTLVHKSGGTVRTFAQAVEHQVVSSVANMESLAASASTILTDHRATRQQAITNGAKGELRAWVFPFETPHEKRLTGLAQLLTDQGIEVRVLENNTAQVAGLTDARSGQRVDLELSKGSLLVRLDQPAGFLIRALLDPHVPMNSAFFHEEREYIEKGKGSRLYETTAWSIPLAYGVQALWGSSIPGGSWRPWSAGAHAPTPSVPENFGSVIFDGSSDRAPGLLTDLLQVGVTVRVAQKPFAIGNRSFDRGAFVVRREGNVDDLGATIAELSEKHGIEFLTVSTSRSQEGPDLGGSHFPVLVPPRTGVLAGMPVSPTAYGSVWHLLDQELNLRFSALDIGGFPRFDLSRYNVLIFPPIYGGPDMYKQLLGTGGMKKLRQWIEAGGTAIGIGGGSRLLADSSAELTKTRVRSQALDSFPPPVWSISAQQAEAAGPTIAVGLRPENPQKEGVGQEPAATRSAAVSDPYDIAPIIGSGARPFVAGHDQGTPLAGEPVPMEAWLKKVLPPGQKDSKDHDVAKTDARLQSFMPRGAMFRAELDEELWLNFGLGSDITVWFGSRDTLVAVPPVSVAARFPEIEQMHLGGLLWPEAAARMAHTAYATREGIGRGQIILFADNPAYRRWMKESERMLINAILLGPGLGTRWSTPW